MTKFFISDTHFGHEKIIQFEGKARPFETIEEHDEELIKRWNARVGKRDTVVHLGDVAFKPATTLDRVMPRLNGIKSLVLGNHDVGNIETLLKYFTKVRAVHEDKKLGILFSHYPVHPSQLEFRYKYNVHGHMHSAEIVHGDYGHRRNKKYLNISCEHTDLAPISLDEILERLEL